jgi:hypothetical protein
LKNIEKESNIIKEHDFIQDDCVKIYESFFDKDRIDFYIVMEKC